MNISSTSTGCSFLIYNTTFSVKMPFSGDGNFTVFAPTNGAFAKIPEDDLNNLLADKDALTGKLPK